MNKMNTKTQSDHLTYLQKTQVDIELNSPEGAKLHNKLQKVIRRFLVKNLMRVTGQPEEAIRNMIIAQPAGVDKRKAQVAQAMKEGVSRDIIEKALVTEKKILEATIAILRERGIIA